METSDIKQLLLNLIEIDAVLDPLLEQKEVTRKQITDWMVLNESEKLTIPNVGHVILQSKTTFSNYPDDVKKITEELNSAKKHAELNGLAEKKTTHFIKLGLDKDGNE